MSTTGSGPGRQASERSDQGSRGNTSGGRSNGNGDRDNGMRDVAGALRGQTTPNAPSGAKNSREADDEMAAKYGMSPDTYAKAVGNLQNHVLDGADFGEGSLNAAVA